MCPQYVYSSIRQDAVCTYIIATNIVIDCILTVQISTTVLHKLPLYWAIE